MNICYTSLMLISKIYMTLFSQNCRVFGADHLPRGAKIIAANHPNITDAFHLPFVIKGHVHTLILGTHFDKPVIGRLLSGSGQIPVFPEHKEAAFQKACEYLGEGETVLIYPEAQWNPEIKRMKGKSGAVRMSLISGAPIIPLGIYVPDDDTRTQQVKSHGKTHQVRWQISGTCYLCFGDPWLPSMETCGDIDLQQIHTLTDQLMGKIFDQMRMAHLESLLDAPANRIPTGINMAGSQAS